LTASNRTGLFSATRSSSASWFEVAVEIHHLLEEAAGLGAGDQLVGNALSVSASAISALSTILLSHRRAASAWCLTTTAPAFVAASHAATSAGLLPERISTRLPGFTP